MFHGIPSLFCSLLKFVDSTECQDGVTNNCTQECTRDSVTGEHHCSCNEGYELIDGSDSKCGGNYNIVLL